ncbi:hypothetical protein C4K19_5765 [Pseudomonas chlororaphis subsp. aurantiaca]|nr:hypothetical protein C4K19_5765 [Pseudomonas chlororaphis subsp. aurantiaca]
MKYLFLIATLFTFNSIAHAGDMQYGSATADKIVCFPNGQCIDINDTGTHP